jgi:hypothetical protein
LPQPEHSRVSVALMNSTPENYEHNENIVIENMCEWCQKYNSLFALQPLEPVTLIAVLRYNKAQV